MEVDIEKIRSTIAEIQGKFIAAKTQMKHLEVLERQKENLLKLKKSEFHLIVWSDYSEKELFLSDEYLMRVVEDFISETDRQRVQVLLELKQFAESIASG